METDPVAFRDSAVSNLHNQGAWAERRWRSISPLAPVPERKISPASRGLSVPYCRFRGVSRGANSAGRRLRIPEFWESVGDGCRRSRRFPGSGNGLGEKERLQVRPSVGIEGSSRNRLGRFEEARFESRAEVVYQRTKECLRWQSACTNRSLRRRAQIRCAPPSAQAKGERHLLSMTP